MSSIVKKSSHFAPKVQKRAVRRPPAATPPASQITDGLPTASQGRETPAENARLGAATAENTPPPLFAYSIPTQAAAKPPATDAADAAVDPTHKAPFAAIPEHAGAGDADVDYGDNDIFKQPSMLRGSARRKLSAHAGAAGGGLGRRNSLMAGAGPGPSGLGDEQAHARDPPVPIGVPQGRPSKKRSASVSRGARRLRRPSAVAIGPVKDTAQEETGAGAKVEAPAGAEPASLSAAVLEQDFVVALCEKTNRMRKFRTSASVESDLPVVPKNLVTSISSVQQLPRRVNKEDEALYAHVSVQADAMSMADLCKPMLQIGLTCETFALAEAAKNNIRRKKHERRDAREMARLHRVSYRQALRELQRDEALDADEQQGFDFERAAREEELAQAASSNLKIAVVDGQFQVDQESVIRGREFAPNSDHRTVELENLFEAPVTSNSYSGKTHTDAWTKDELVQFYNALSTWGTDFTFVAQLFPYRTRRQIKNKFTLEEKHNPQLVELALRRKLPPDFADFCAKASGVKSIKTVDEFNRELAELKREHEAHIRDINSERERAIKEDLEANRKREIEMRTGAKPMTKAERSRMIRQNEVVVGEIDDVKRTRELLDAGGAL
ncbi:transcription factor IIIB, Bdp1 subunit [Metschnikowia bicuspidata var. bicuspidata NRRL YB-4993]|uniref:Transcription factor IIIB, Bdp1 subunit n=1 Tax=Metschnikowia bicuspidata var. bicuspidata NRRL YB-4993 TaxID=869754 RepID=A0A1A0HIN9_9ASCO|nr:transcription factor IIIB, Bdp1 subunit [Metschnikowia bicuspidata var. bicuspidata NRRL YB-4993]OBA23752.1 transcription factor IIIB, Bdp1 subunit [Metschnikowia bicuspidata var. bicuspidata NRRL YB-4993]